MHPYLRHEHPKGARKLHMYNKHLQISGRNSSKLRFPYTFVLGFPMILSIPPHICTRIINVFSELILLVRAQTFSEPVLSAESFGHYLAKQSSRFLPSCANFFD